MSKLVKVLRDIANDHTYCNGRICQAEMWMEEAADAIEKLRAEVSALRETLKRRGKSALPEMVELRTQNSTLQELAAEFVDSWLGDGDGTGLDGLAHRMAEVLDRDSGRQEQNDG